MKDSVITVRLPRATRRRIEVLARREGRSLSQLVERLIARGMGGEETAPVGGRRRRARPLAGILRGTRVPTLADFREVRALVSASLGRLTRHDHPRR